ncbi:MAG TPA: response regulator [Jatrophihabitantaceae bacterium]|jgi:two-component system cell cycle response regulator DivK
MARQPTVLVVEDNDKSLKLFCALLELRGYRTETAITVAEAVATALRVLPDLVVMDIQLPDGDGAAALSALRADQRTCQLPVVAVTAFAMPGDRERLLAAGFDGYITKPIDAHTFVDDLSALIRPEH